MSLEGIVRLACEIALDAIGDGDLGPGHARSFVEAFAVRLELDPATERLGNTARQALATKGVAE